MKRGVVRAAISRARALRSLVPQLYNKRPRQVGGASPRECLWRSTHNLRVLPERTHRKASCFIYSQFPWLVRPRCLPRYIPRTRLVPGPLYGGTMLRLSISVAFAIAVATSAQAMSPVPLHEPDPGVTHIADGQTVRP